MSKYEHILLYTSPYMQKVIPRCTVKMLFWGKGWKMPPPLPLKSRECMLCIGFCIVIAVCMSATLYPPVNSIQWAPHEFGLILACASSDESFSILTCSEDGQWKYHKHENAHNVSLHLVLLLYSITNLHVVHSYPADHK